jgi:hypothetical protein
MAGTTTNYGWTYPTSTDLVKDGATAIQTAIQGADTSLFSITGGKNMGLVPLNTTSYSAQSTINIDSVFSSTYQNYLVINNVSARTSNGALVLRFRAAGVTTTSATYDYAGNLTRTTGGGVNLPFGAAADIYSYFTFSNADPTSTQLTIYSPNEARQTNFSSAGWGSDTTSQFAVTASGRQTGSTQFDGISIIVTAGTITGTTRIYGIRNP